MASGVYVSLPSKSKCHFYLLEWLCIDESGNSSILERWKSQGLTICWVGVDGVPQLILSAGDQLRIEAVTAVKSIRV